MIEAIGNFLEVIYYLAVLAILAEIAGHAKRTAQLIEKIWTDQERDRKNMRRYP